MFCPNCGMPLGAGVNFCPNCGTRVSTVVASTPPKPGNMVMLESLDGCNRATAALVLSKLCGYDADDALLIVDSTPITVARGLTDAQARYLAQALVEYGMEIAVHDGVRWRDWESDTTSVWDQSGSLLAGVASVLGLLGLGNRISRDMMHRMEVPSRPVGGRPPAFRLNSALRAAPRPPIHRAPPPPPRPVRTVAPPPPPPRPAPPPARPIPPSPQPPQPGPGPAPRGVPGRGIPGGRSGGGSGRRS